VPRFLILHEVTPEHSQFFLEGIVMDSQKIPVILRSFKPKSDFSDSHIPFVELSAYQENLRAVIDRYLGMSIIGTIYIVTNGDPRSPLAELVVDGETPATRFAQSEYADTQRVQTIICREKWGANVGSATALTDGLRVILDSEMVPEHVLIASTTVDLSQEAIFKALHASETYHLQVVGFLRQNHWERYQWRLVQNTAALWRSSTFQRHGFFFGRVQRQRRQYR